MHNTLSDGLMRTSPVTWNSYALRRIYFRVLCICNTLSDGLMRTSLVTCWNSYIYHIVLPSSVLCIHNTLSDGLMRTSPVTWNSCALHSTSVPCTYNTLSDGLMRTSLVTCWNSYIVVASVSLFLSFTVLSMYNTLSDGLMRTSPVTWISYTCTPL